MKEGPFCRSSSDEALWKDLQKKGNFMALSQNLIFQGEDFIDSDPDDVPGKGIIDFLHVELKNQGWKVSDPDIMQGSWTFETSMNNAQLEIALAGGTQLWFLQIRRVYSPGFIGNLFNKKPSGNEKDIYKLAVVVHELIARKYNNLKWAWDAAPSQSKDASLTPTEIKEIV